jgi:putative membrane protein
MKIGIATLFAGLAAAWIPASALAHGDENGGGSWSHNWAGEAGHMAFGSLAMILFWGGLILLIVLAVRWFGGTSGNADRPATGSTALETLQKRFARGEMERDDFEEQKRLLQ